MTHATQENRQVQTDAPAAPPNVECPSWCIGNCRWWHDGTEWYRHHTSRPVCGSSDDPWTVKVVSCDLWSGVALTPFDVHVVVELEYDILTVQQHAKFLADQARAHVLALS